MSLPPAKKHKKSSGHHFYIFLELEEKFAGIIKPSPKGVEYTYGVTVSDLNLWKPRGDPV